jgi:hypothetical protein
MNFHRSFVTARRANGRRYGLASYLIKTPINLFLQADF